MPPDAQQGAPAPDDQQSGMPPAEGDQGPLAQMILQTDKAIMGIAQVLAKASPEAAQAMQQVSGQFRAIIQSVLQQDQGASGQDQSSGPQPAGQMSNPETQGKEAMQAY